MIAILEKYLELEKLVCMRRWAGLRAQTSWFFFCEKSHWFRLHISTGIKGSDTIVPGSQSRLKNRDKSQLSTGTIVGFCSRASSYINNTPNNFSMLTIKKLVLNCFISIAELSLVEITPRWRYQMKIFIFSGILSFQINLFRNGVPWFIRNRTLKWSCLCKFQVKVSLSFKSCLTGEFSY